MALQTINIMEKMPINSFTELPVFHLNTSPLIT